MTSKATRLQRKADNLKFIEEAGCDEWELERRNHVAELAEKFREMKEAYEEVYE